MNELWELNNNLGHWLFELETDLIAGLIGLLIGRFGLRRHDRRFHPDSTHER